MLENPGLELELSQKETRFSLIAFEKSRFGENQVEYFSFDLHFNIAKTDGAEQSS